MENQNNNIPKNNEESMILTRNSDENDIHDKNILSFYRTLCCDYASSPTSIYCIIGNSTLFGILLFSTMLHTSTTPAHAALWPIFGGFYLMLGYNIFIRCSAQFGAFGFCVVMHSTYLFILIGMILFTQTKAVEVNGALGVEYSSFKFAILFLIYSCSKSAAPQPSSSSFLSDHFIVGITLWIGLLVYNIVGFYCDAITTTNDIISKDDNIIDWICVIITIHSWAWIKFGFLDNIER